MPSEVAILGPPLPPTTFRPRRAVVAAAALAAFALLFGLHIHQWYGPYRLGASWREWPLPAGALAAGALAWLALPRLAQRFARARFASASVAALLAYLALQAADPFAGRRFWLYAPARCDLAVEFPRRANAVAGEVRAGDLAATPVSRVLLTDLGTASALGAECVAFESALPEGARAAALDAAEALLKAQAARLRLNVQRVARVGGDMVALAGYTDEGRTATNEALVRRGEARAVLGASSLLVLWAWKIQREGETARFGEAFFASVRPAARP